MREVYDMIFEELQERVNNGEITVEEAEAVNELAYERHVVKEEFIDESFEFDEDTNEIIDACVNGYLTFTESMDLIEESIKDGINENKVYKETFKKAYDEYSTNMKMIKMCVRNKDYEQAKQIIKDAKDSLNNLEKIIDDMPETVDGKTVIVISNMLRNMTSLSLALMMLFKGSTYKETLKYSSAVTGIFAGQDIIKMSIKGNTYRNKFKKLISEEKKNLLKIELKIKNKEKDPEIKREELLKKLIK